MVSIPFSTLCDPLISNAEDGQKLLAHAIKLYSRSSCRYLEIRTLNTAQLFSGEMGFKKQVLFKHHYLPLDSKSIENIFKSFQRTSVRKNIRRAQRAGLTIRVVKSIDELRTCYSLYSDTRTRLGLPPVPIKFYENMWRIFAPKKSVVWLLAESGSQPVASMMLLRFKHKMSAECLGWDIRFNSQRPTAFIYWKAIKMAHREGIKIFDFGRTACSNKGLLLFKKHWGTTEIDLPFFYYPNNYYTKSGRPRSLTPLFSRMIFQNIPKKFSRFLGDMLYRHMG